MKPEEFVKKYFPFAQQIEKETRIPAIAIMAQAALESSWGNRAIGNNFFGIKFKKGDFGFQKILTTEYSNSQNAFKGQEIISVTYDKQLNKYKYKIYQYFADYKTPYEGFLAHSKLLLSERYIGALRWSYSPKRYLIAIAQSGYATAPAYAKTLCQMVDSITKRL